MAISYGIGLGLGARFRDSSQSAVNTLNRYYDRKAREGQYAARAKQTKQDELNDLIKEVKIDYSEWLPGYADKAKKVMAEIIYDYHQAKASGNVQGFRDKVILDYMPELNQAYNGNKVGQQILKDAAEGKRVVPKELLCIACLRY